MIIIIICTAKTSAWWSAVSQELARQRTPNSCLWLDSINDDDGADHYDAGADHYDDDADDDDDDDERDDDDDDDGGDGDDGDHDHDNDDDDDDNYDNDDHDDDYAGVGEGWWERIADLPHRLYAHACTYLPQVLIMTAFAIMTMMMICDDDLSCV